jgi:hypothetical protein
MLYRTSLLTERCGSLVASRNKPHKYKGNYINCFINLTLPSSIAIYWVLWMSAHVGSGRWSLLYAFFMQLMHTPHQFHYLTLSSTRKYLMAKSSVWFRVHGRTSASSTLAGGQGVGGGGHSSPAIRFCGRTSSCMQPQRQTAFTKLCLPGRISISIDMNSIHHCQVDKMYPQFPVPRRILLHCGKPRPLLL